MSGSGPGGTQEGAPEPVEAPPPPSLDERLRGGWMHLSWRTRHRVGRMLRPWTRSLHIRVVTITVLLGMLVSFALGSFMYQRIADGLVSARMSSAQQQAQSQRIAAQAQLSNVEKTDRSTLYLTALDIVSTIASPLDDRSRQAVLERAFDNQISAVPTVFSKGSDPSRIPTAIKQALVDDPTHQQAMVMTTIDSNGRRTPAVIVGSRVAVPNAGAYDLYLIFPMNQELQTLSIVKNSFLVGGFALVILLGGLAYMVTRMVVTPVRAARHVAERLASGALNERMRVNGEDDLARLATSFNAMADSLQRQIRQLEDLSEVQQRFTSDVSHELRTPLTTIRMAADLIHASREGFRAPVARSAELLAKELDRFEMLLADLLEISRFDAGAAALERERVDLRDVVRRVVESSGPLAARAGSHLLVHAAVPCVAEMDQRRVERIVRNLVTNAIEHGDGKPIEITVGANSTAVAVSVRDYGVGLRPGDASMVFGRFWRADPARARTTGGTGLGLSIALEDARLHHGWLQAWGEPGEGSCFRLTLPLREGVTIKRAPVRLVDASSEEGHLVPQGPAAPRATDAASAIPGSPPTEPGRHTGTADSDGASLAVGRDGASTGHQDATQDPS